MRDFHLQAGEARHKLMGALFLYGSGENIHYVTKHAAVVAGTPEQPHEEFAPGVAVTPEGLISMFEQLTKTHSLNTEILPANALSISGEHLVWWVPEGKRRVFFKCKELGQRWGVLPHPPLLFVVVRGKWSIFALPKNERPTAETALCHAPYFNVYDNHTICTGSAAVPSKAAISTIPEWEAAFFDSEFTHPNGSIKKASHPRGEYAMWKELLDDVYETFPMQYLVSAEKTVNDVMTSLRKQLGAA